MHLCHTLWCPNAFSQRLTFTELFKRALPIYWLAQIILLLLCIEQRKVMLSEIFIGVYFLLCWFVNLSRTLLKTSPIFIVHFLSRVEIQFLALVRSQILRKLKRSYLSAELLRLFYKLRNMDRWVFKLDFLVDF